MLEIADLTLRALLDPIAQIATILSFAVTVYGSLRRRRLRAGSTKASRSDSSGRP